MRVAAELWLFLKPAHRSGTIQVGCDGISSLGHVVQSLGVPLTEVGDLVVNGKPVTPAYRPGGGDVVEVAAVARPQPVPAARFLLDVHLGALARRLRLAGVDTAYANDADDDALIEQASTERRVLLTQDRGLLRRRALWLGAYVRGAHPDAQLADVLDRFAPPLAPGPGAPPATARSALSLRPRLSRCCSPAPGAATRRSPAASPAARCTGAAHTANGSRPSSPQHGTLPTPPVAPPAHNSTRHIRAFGGGGPCEYICGRPTQPMMEPFPAKTC